MITLGIIGIVAAMTMPSLISKYQMKSFEVALKKQYSVLQDAINFVSLEESINECSVNYKSGNVGYSFKKADCGRLVNALISRLDLKKAEGFKISYMKKSEVLSKGGKTINSSCDIDGSVTDSEAYMTKDGAVILFYNRGGYMVIDVNGMKGPNRWGYDVFYFTFTTHSAAADKILLTDELCSVVEKGGVFPRTILQNQKENKNTNMFWN